MIKFENVEVTGWEHAIRGMRNPMNSWDKSDSFYCADMSCTSCPYYDYDNHVCGTNNENYIIAPNDMNLMKRLRNAGTDHRKFMRMITVYVDITAPLYLWKELDTYSVGVVKNSCSTMHTIHKRDLTMADFSYEYLMSGFKVQTGDNYNDFVILPGAIEVLENTITAINRYRAEYLKTKDKIYWEQMIRLLPSSYNQKRTVMMNYEVLANIYKSRRNHKLDEWCEHKERVIDSTSQALYSRDSETYFGFCDWIKTLPYSELITGEE